MSNQNPMQDYLNRLQRQVQRGGPGGGGFRRPSSGLVGLVGGGLLLVGGLWGVQSALFNVDGGHRAIKYRRTSGVSKEVYGEGALSRNSIQTDMIHV